VGHDAVSKPQAEERRRETRLCGLVRWDLRAFVFVHGDRDEMISGCGCQSAAELIDSASDRRVPI